MVALVVRRKGKKRKIARLMRLASVHTAYRSCTRCYADYARVYVYVVVMVVVLCPGPKQICEETPDFSGV